MGIPTGARVECHCRYQGPLFAVHRRNLQGRQRRGSRHHQPRDCERLSTVSTVNGTDIDRAVKAARRAYEDVWVSYAGCRARQVSLPDRARDRGTSRELAVVETLDNGKPIKETRDFDVLAAAQHFFYHAGWPTSYNTWSRTGRNRSVWRARSIPWNFPLLMAAWKIAPALAKGNTVVIKPAETTPLSILVLAEIIADTELPPGVVNIVAGAGRWPTRWSIPGHRQGRLHRIHRRRGRHIQREPAGTGRKITLSLAARAPTSCSRTRRVTRPSRGLSMASSSTRARSAAGSCLPGAGVDRR